MSFDPETDSEDELPPGWEERSTIDGQVFYANHITKSTQWTHPRTGCKKRLSSSLPFGWSQEILDDGKVLYVNHEDQKTSYTDPRLAFAIEEKDSSKKSFDSKIFRQRFDASSKAMQILHGMDLSDKIALVTGASIGGIGFEIAKSLAFTGCNVILACRTLNKAIEACEIIIKEKPTASKCFPMQVDLTSLRSVYCFAKNFNEKFSQLNVLILNAGVFALDFRLTSEDRLEEIFQVNYLAQVYLAYLLRDSMSRCLKPKLIYIACESHRFVDINYESIENGTASLFDKNEKNFSSMIAYNKSKLFGLMFALQAHEEWSHYGIRSIAVHPGNMVSTNLARNWWIYRILFAIVKPFTKTLQQAASSAIYAGFAPEMEDSYGIYKNNCFPTDPSNLASNRHARKLIWNQTFVLLKQKLYDIDEKTVQNLI